MRKIFILFIFISGNICGQDRGAIKATEQTSPRILIINSFDANRLNYRKNKKELFAELADTLKSWLAEKIVSLELGTPKTIDERMPQGFDSTSLLDSVFRQYNASIVVVIKSLNVFFQNSGESVERNSDGKREKTIRYDLCTAITYVVYKGDGNAGKTNATVEECEFFTERTSQGAFSIQAGPDIVGKKKHTYKAVNRNAEKFVKYDL